MSSFSLSFSLLCCMVLIFPFIINLGGNMAQAQEVISGQKTWCVAKPSTDIGMLESNINFACNQIGVDCSIIQEGGECYYPNNDINHASVVMNLYYQKAGPVPFNCDFINTGLIVLTDPSYGPCLYYSI